MESRRYARAMPAAAPPDDPLVAERIRALQRALADAVPASSVELRGSRAEGSADAFSDIDLEWHVGERGDEALLALPTALAGVGPVESLRLDPDTLPSGVRRLVFVRIAHWSLFQRIDLELTGSFGGPPPGWTRPWPLVESAVMNVVAATKAEHRGRGDVDGLLQRAADRVGLGTLDGPTQDRMRRVLDAAVRADPRQADLAARARALLA